ncbi:MAG: hypothetical protein FGM32_11265, partial [Candidatus Kapabacteria bacterium]|nr:hypothetical protein [Candidatus Kapabacteria bacterium]
MKLTLRVKLALLYGAIVALSLAGFAAIAYVTVSNELVRNLDASLERAGTSLLAVIRREQMQARRPLTSMRPRKRSAQRESLRVEFLDQPKVGDFVGPVLN